MDSMTDEQAARRPGDQQRAPNSPDYFVMFVRISVSSIDNKELYLSVARQDTWIV